MRLTNLTVLTILSYVLANPLPVPDPEPQGEEVGVAGIAGVNITNVEIAGTAAVVKNSYIVVYKEGVPDSAADAYEDKVSKRIGSGLKKKYRVKSTTAGARGFSAVNVETDKKGLEAIAKDPLVAFVELDGFGSVSPIFVNTTDRAAGKGEAGAATLISTPGTWGLGRISHRLRGYWNYIFDDSACAGTRIYILDTGIRTTHEQFRGIFSWFPWLNRAVFGANFIWGSPNTDENGHGTHCAGTAAGYNVGVCRRATVVSVKVLNKDGKGPFSGIIAGMQWAANDAISRGYRYKSVISLSLGGGYSPSVNLAVQGIINAGIPVVVAAGNDDINAWNVSPASAPNAITVGATDYNDRRAYFPGWWGSNWGPVLDIFAPGVSVYSSYFNSNNNYAYLSGTSQATPHVAGVAAYLISKEKIAGAINIRNRIVALSTKNKVIDPKGSPNRILYNGSGF